MTSLRGVTLLESLIALFLLGLLLGPILSSMSQSTRIINVGSNDLDVVNLADGFVSQVRALSPHLLPETGGPQALSAPDTDGWITLGMGAGSRIRMPAWNKDKFLLTYEILRFPLSDTLDGLAREGRLITLHIGWKEAIGEQRQATFPVLSVLD